MERTRFNPACSKTDSILFSVASKSFSFGIFIIPGLGFYDTPSSDVNIKPKTVKRSFVHWLAAGKDLDTMLRKTRISSSIKNAGIGKALSLHVALD